LKTNLVAVAKDDFFGSKLFYGLLFLPFLDAVIVLLKKKKKLDGDVVGNRIRRNNKTGKEIFIASQKTN
jgi:hypothetical protein